MIIRNQNTLRCWLCVIITLALSACLAMNNQVSAADEKSPTAAKKAGDTAHGLPLLFEETFDKGADGWKPTDPEAWSVDAKDGKKFYSQHKASKYKPTHRSPFNYSLLSNASVGDFVLEADVQSTRAEYGHRDICLFFGHQDADHFYYVHMATKADDHANQIFIVNGSPRKKISITSTSGVKWTEGWHHVKLVRKIDDGTIEVYFEDMEKPIMTAKDKTFGAGKIGIGTFDDTGNFDNIKLYGVKK